MLPRVEGSEKQGIRVLTAVPESLHFTFTSRSCSSAGSKPGRRRRRWPESRAFQGRDGFLRRVRYSTAAGSEREPAESVLGAPLAARCLRLVPLPFSANGSMAGEPDQTRAQPGPRSPSLPALMRSGGRISEELAVPNAAPTRASAVLSAVLIPASAGPNAAPTPASAALSAAPIPASAVLSAAPIPASAVPNAVLIPALAARSAATIPAAAPNVATAAAC